MHTLLHVALGEDLAGRVDRALPRNWQAKAVSSWAAAVRVLVSRDPPDGMLFTSRDLNDDVRRALIKLSVRGYGVPSSVLILSSDSSLAYFAGRIHRHDVRPIFGLEGLEEGIGALVARAGRPLSVRLERVVRTSDPTWRALIALLESDRTYHNASPELLAAKLDLSRSGLYRRLREAEVPSPRAVQDLFRMWPGIQRVVGGGSGEDAAFEARRPHSTAFRRAVARHFGVSLSALRKLGDLDRALRRWANQQKRVRLKARDTERTSR